LRNSSWENTARNSLYDIYRYILQGFVTYLQFLNLSKSGLERAYYICYILTVRKALLKAINEKGKTREIGWRKAKEPKA